MLKNKEIRYFILVQIICMCLCLIICLVGIVPGWIALILLGICLIASNIGFTRIRYQRMRQLTEYMVRIQESGNHLDIRDNEEGELSILKNEIYKLSVKLNTQAELLLRDKTFLADSISDISHQLKTPLTSMMMMVDLMKAPDLSKEKQQEFLNNIFIGMERMEWLILSLLKLSKLDAQAVSFKSEPLEVCELLQDAVKPLLIPMELRQIELSVQTVNEKVIINGDRQWLSEAITNIVKNCMEHTKCKGRITISYSDNNLYTKIIITDTGSGIDLSELPFIFDRFYRGKNSKSDSVGIGLALSKQIIMNQKGRIDVASKIGEGTSFTIRIYR